MHLRYVVYEYFLVRAGGLAQVLPEDREVELDGVDERAELHALVCAPPTQALRVGAQLFLIHRADQHVGDACKNLESGQAQFVLAHQRVAIAPRASKSSEEILRQPGDGAVDLRDDVMPALFVHMHNATR